MERTGGRGVRAGVARARRGPCAAWVRRFLARFLGAFCAALAIAAAAGAQDVRQVPLSTGANGTAEGSRPGEPAASGARDLPPNTTIVPRSSAPAVGETTSQGQVTLAALLTADGQNIEQGLVWRVFHAKPGADKKPQLISTHREASPTLRLDPGDYVVNVAFGRAHLTRRISVRSGAASREAFVLNAGGLRVSAVLANGEPIGDRSVVSDVYSDERDQYGQRTKVMSGLRPGIVARLNAGIYSLVSTYGDANAVARADVTIEAGKLTEVTLRHAAAKATFKLVAVSGGDAVTDAEWTVANAQGEVVKESAGAVPTHILAPGNYTVSARHAGQVYSRQFTVRAGDFVEVEVLMR